MSPYRGSKVERVKAGEEVTQDDSRPAFEASRGGYMLNSCKDCGRYKWVYINRDPGDGKGPRYICGGCLKAASQKRTA